MRVGDASVSLGIPRWIAALRILTQNAIEQRTTAATNAAGFAPADLVGLNVHPLVELAPQVAISNALTMTDDHSLASKLGILTMIINLTIVQNVVRRSGGKPARAAKWGCRRRRRAVLGMVS